MPREPRPDDWRDKVKGSVRNLIIARNGIRYRDLSASLIGLMWEFLLSDVEIDEVISDMMKDKTIGVVMISMGKTEPVLIYTLPSSIVTVVNNNAK